jgi:hypothetical protein
VVKAFSYCDNCDSRKDYYKILFQIIIYEKETNADTIGRVQAIAYRFYRMVAVIKLFCVQHTGIKQHRTKFFIVSGSNGKIITGAIKCR